MSVQNNRRNRAFVENCIRDTIQLRNQLNRIGGMEELQGVLNEVMNDLEIIYSVNHAYDENLPTSFLPSENIPEYTAENIPYRVRDLAQLVHLSLGTMGYHIIFEDVNRNLERDFDEAFYSDMPELVPMDMNDDLYSDLPELVSISESNDFASSEAEGSIVLPEPRGLYSDLYRNFDGFYTQTFIHPMPSLPCPKIKSKVLNKTRLNAVMEDVCGICLDNHKKRDTYSCRSCSHDFGQECFRGWMEMRKKNRQEINCPTCRTNVKELKSFREKAKKHKYAQVHMVHIHGSLVNI